ncbi:MAG: hypothetical protein N2Z21_04125 [Candidatus Sumerlaeaceae bacterium]|nr:hypothetical protein [Candidatus Sumerlaeaceae bacterium]
MISRYMELRQLGLKWSHWLGEWLASKSPATFLLVCHALGTMEWLWRRKARKRVAKQLRALQSLAGVRCAPAKPRDYFTNFWRLKLAHAYIALAPFEQVEKIVKIEGLEHLHAALETRKGAILASLHSLHGHLAAAYVVRLGVPTISFRKATREGYVGTSAERLIFYGAQPVFMDETQPFGAVLKRCYDWLRQGNAVFVYVDGVYGCEEAVVSIFGRKVLLRPGLLRSAALVKAPIISVAATSERNHLIIRFFPFVVVQDGEDIQKILQSLAQAYEDMVSRCPASLALGKFERRLIR